MDALSVIALGLAGSGGGGGSDVTKKYVDDGLALKADKTETAEYPIADSVSGDAISVTGTADANVQKLTVYGKSRKSVNLFDKTATDVENGYVADGYLASDGSVVISEDHIISEYIEITPDTNYVISGMSGGANAPSYCLYNNNYEYIYGSRYNRTTEKNIALYSQTKYIRISVEKSQINSMQFELGSTASPYEPYGKIFSIGDGGSLTITTTDGTASSTATLTTGLPLCGIPVDSGETYTDGDGVKWLADSADDEGVVKRCGVVDLGDYTWTYDSTYTRFITQISTIKQQPDRTLSMVCSRYQVIDDGRAVSNIPDKSISSNMSDIHVKDTAYTDPAVFKAAVAGVKLIYPLATPTTTPLTPAEKSAFLNLKTFDDTTNLSITDDPFVDFGYLKNTENGKAVEQLADNLRASIGWISAVPEMHRNIFRGQSLGSSVTAAQLAAINAGTFDDLYVGDYWTIPVTIGGETVSVNWRIVDIDYYYKRGEAYQQNAHHLVIMPDMAIDTVTPNSADYSSVRSTILTTSKTIVTSAFPNMVIPYSEDFGDGSTIFAADSEVEVPDAISIVGNLLMRLSTTTTGTHTFSSTQFSLFRLAPKFIATSSDYLTRDRSQITNSDYAVIEANKGRLGVGAANSAHGIRPYFLIGVAS